MPLTITDDPSQYLTGLVVGGDSSEQGPVEDRLLCYALVGVQQERLSQLDTIIRGIIRDHTGVDSEDIEVHAKDIWNGSARSRGPFSALATKQAMKSFFEDLIRELSTLKPMISIAVSHLSSQDWFLAANKRLRRRRYATIKRWLMYAAFSRLDRNVSLLADKHVGIPPFHLDFETEKAVHTGATSMIEIAGKFDDAGELSLHRRIAPGYLPSASSGNRLIQVADVAAYFGGKYLTLFAQIYGRVSGGLTTLDDKLYDLMRDCNFSLAAWDQFDMEVVLSISREQIGRQPDWQKGITDPYKRAFDAGADNYSCSIREAVSRSGTQDGALSGVGYWSLLAAGRTAT